MVLALVRGGTSAAESARKNSFTIAEIERWSEQFFAAGENALQGVPRGRRGAKDEQVERLKEEGRSAVLGVDILKEANKGRPFGPGMSDE